MATTPFQQLSHMRLDSPFRTLDLCSKVNYAQLVNNLFVSLYIPLPLYLVQIGLLVPIAYTPPPITPPLLTRSINFALCALTNAQFNNVVIVTRLFSFGHGG